MIITLNGDKMRLSDGRSTVADLVEQLKLSHSPVAVEVNRQLVPKRQHEQHELNDGDTVEVVTLVGGG